MKTPNFEPGVICLVTRPKKYSKQHRGKIVTLVKMCAENDQVISKEGETFIARLKGRRAWWCSNGPFCYGTKIRPVTFDEIVFEETELTPLPGLENEDEIFNEVSKPLEMV